MVIMLKYVDVLDNCYGHEHVHLGNDENPGCSRICSRIL